MRDRLAQATRIKTTSEKLGLKAAGALRLFAAPPGVAALLGALPDGAALVDDPAAPCPLALVFARDCSELVRQMPRAMAALTPGGALWVAFYKKSSAQKTDLDRDIIREHAMILGLKAVAIIAIDAQWSALRFKTV